MCGICFEMAGHGFARAKLARIAALRQALAGLRNAISATEFKKLSPAAQMGNVTSAADGVGFAKKAFDFGVVKQPDGTDAEWRGNGGDEGAEGVGGELPDF
jgi:hypothetical protein